MGAECTIGSERRIDGRNGGDAGSRGRTHHVITQYHRPTTLDEALALLARPDVTVIGGGTSVVAGDDGASAAIVDLQDLPLATIEAESARVRIGATTRLQALVDDPVVPAVIAEAAVREAPRSLRNAATIGGTIVVADAESELVTALIALDASVQVTDGAGAREVPVTDLIGDPAGLAAGLITAVSVTTEGRAAAARTGRTPMDRPIVAVVAHRHGDRLRVAASGVGDRPMLIDPARVADLDPPTDFRGSADYRRHLARILTERALAAVGAAP